MTISTLKIVMEIHQWDAFAQPSWSWTWAHRLRDTQLGISTIKEHCGEWIGRAVGSLRFDRIRYPEIDAALGIFDAAGCLRDELEARILARQTDSEIAQRMGLEDRTVAAYANLFYVVRDRLEASCWIRNVAIAWEGVGKPLPLGQFLKHMAYHHGIVILEWLRPLLQQIATATLEGSLGKLRSSVTAIASVCRAIQINSMPITEDNLFDVFRMHAQLMRADLVPYRQDVERPEQPSSWHAGIFTDFAPINCPDARAWAVAAA